LPERLETLCVNACVTEKLKQNIEGDAASLSIELAERAIADAARAGFSLDDLEPEFGHPETIIRECWKPVKERREKKGI
jgi:hypothetical protein